MMLWLHDPRLKPLAASPLPAWLWSQDATRVLWANPIAAAIFGAATAAALSRRMFDSGQPAAAQVERLAETLPVDGKTRLERLRGFGAGIGRTLTCSCSRLRLDDGTPAVLIAATEPGGPDLPLKERVTRLLAGSDDVAVAVFAGDGALIHATPAARTHLRDKTSLGAAALAAAAGGHGHIAGCSTAGSIEIDRFGDNTETVFVVSFGAADAPGTTSAPSAPAGEGAPQPIEAVHGIAGSSVDGPERPLESEPATTVDAAPPPALPDDRRHPLRFVWQIDSEGRFTVDSEEFIALMGPRTAALLGQSWQAIASGLNLDPDKQVASAVATRDTWSGLSVRWPIDGSDERLCVELSGLPVFDRERAFRGYRGFGVCRDVGRLNGLAKERLAVTTNVATTDEPAGAQVVDEHAVEPAPDNVVPLQPAEADAPTLSPVERHAFYELSRRLTGRINEADSGAGYAPESPAVAAGAETSTAFAAADRADDDEQFFTQNARPFLDRLPIGVLVYRLSHLLYANSAFLTWAGYDDLDTLAEAGGLDSLMVEPGALAIEEGGRKAFSITSPGDPDATAEARLLQVPWDGESAFALLTTPPNAEATAKANAAVDQARAQADELKAILDTATDGVIVIDRAAHILSSNRSAQALFSYDAHELEGRSFNDLFAPESAITAIDYLDGLQTSGVATLLNDGREIIGRERQGGLIPLFMTMGRLGEQGGKFCAVFRDITHWKKVEEDLIAAKREAERASTAKSDFLAKISHEIRTPLNAVIGFSEVMMAERFGPVGNERYRQYLKDIHASGGHLISLVNDLLDLSKIEAGKLELTFASVSVNDLTQQCVAIMQQQANRERIIIRTSLSPKLPQVVADARSVRQIVLNLLSNSIKFTSAGGQVIVSTAMTDTGDVVLRVRDTGIGMTEKDIATALEPFRQVATVTRGRSSGTGLGLPLSKALAEANQAAFHIKSTPNAGTLVEITFPPTRVLVPQT